MQFRNSVISQNEAADTALTDIQSDRIYIDKAEDELKGLHERSAHLKTLELWGVSDINQENLLNDMDILLSAHMGDAAGEAKRLVGQALLYPKLSRAHADLDMQIATSQSSINHTKRRMSSALQILEQENFIVRRKFDIASIQQQLDSVPDVAKGSAYLTQNRRGPWLNFRFNPVKAEVENIMFSYAIDEAGERFDSDDKVKIPIDETEVRINLVTNNVLLAPALPQTSTPFNFNGGYDVTHPHILAHYAPCLGNFEGPITQAVYEKDFKTAALLLRTFLTRIDGQDAAGSHWWKYFTKFHSTEEVRHIRKVPELGYPFFSYHDGDETWEVVFSSDPDVFMPFDD